MIKEFDNIEYVILLCQKIVQPIGDLYTTSIDWQTLKEISYTSPRILMGQDENGKEEYAGIQRELSPDRKKEIALYVNKDTKATFPTSIILNIPIEELDVIPVKFDFKVSNKFIDNELKNTKINQLLNIEFVEQYFFVFPFKENVAQIIDGQHRMSGFENSQNELKFDLPVTIFIDQLISTQAEIFSTINGKQTRVTPSLIYDLFGLSLKRSPYKVINELIKLLNESDNSPIKNWIRILGKPNEFYNGHITQSTIAKQLILLICGNIKQAEEDKRILASGGKPNILPSLTTRETVLREFYLLEEDEVIYKIVTNYLNALKDVFSLEWTKEESIFKKTVGFSALIKVFDVLAKKGKAQNNLKFDFFKEQLERSKSISFEDIQLSSKGINQMFDRFIL